MGIYTEIKRICVVTAHVDDRKAVNEENRFFVLKTQVFLYHFGVFIQSLLPFYTLQCLYQVCH